MSNLEGWPSFAVAALGPLAVLVLWSLADPSTGAATLILCLLVGLAVVALNGG